MTYFLIVTAALAQDAIDPQTAFFGQLVQSFGLPGGLLAIGWYVGRAVEKIADMRPEIRIKLEDPIEIIEVPRQWDGVDRRRRAEDRVQ